MKKIFILLIILSASYTYSQGSFTISEKEYITACGKLLIVDAIWMNEGMMMADISLLDKPNSKPITGGYKTGDEITLSSTEGCTYYISSVRKYGTDNKMGIVTISKDPPLPALGYCETQMTLYEGSSIKIDTLDWNFYSINEGSVYIKISYKTAFIEELTVTEGKNIWMNECLYRVESIRQVSRDKEKDPQGYIEKNPPEVILKRIQSSIYNK